MTIVKLFSTTLKTEDEIMVEFAQEGFNMLASFDEMVEHIELYNVEEEDDFFDEKVYFE